MKPQLPDIHPSAWIAPTAAVMGDVTLGADTALSGSTITFAGRLDGAHALTVNNSGALTFAGAVGATTALDTLTQQGGGAVALDGTSVTTSGTQRYASRIQASGEPRFRFQQDREVAGCSRQCGSGAFV